MLFYRHQNWLIRGHFDCDYRRFFINCSWHFRHASAHSCSSFTLTDLCTLTLKAAISRTRPHVTRHVCLYIRRLHACTINSCTVNTNNTYYIICTKAKRGCAREEDVFFFSISCSLALFSFFLSLRSYSRLF